VRGEPVSTYINEIQISPSGAVYKILGGSILYSADAVSLNFEEIQLPESAEIALFGNGPFTVLDDDLLILHARNQFESYYTSDNGNSWLPIPQYYSYIEYLANRLIGNEIVSVLIGDYSELIMRKINIETGEMNSISVALPDVGHIYSDIVIQDNGTVFFEAETGIFSYNEVDGFNFVIEGQGWTDSGNNFIPIFDKLYRINKDSCEIIENGSLYQIESIGLPYGNHHSIFARSEHILVISNSNELYKTKEPIQRLNKVTGYIKYDQDANCTDEEEYLLNNWRIDIKGEIS